MKILDRIRRYASTHGCTCDACGAELFDYYPRRLCDACLQKLCNNDTRSCPKCGRHTRALGVCSVCKSRMPTFVKGFSPFVYKGKTAFYINRMKNGVRRLAFFFGERMAEYFLRAVEAWNGVDRYVLDERSALIAYVPIAPERISERGYNQAQELALSFGETLARLGVAVPVGEDVITLNRGTQSQKGLKTSERIRNVKGAYHVKKRALCKDKVVLLIDDIMTTGATGSECADALLRAGAKAVLFFTVASLEEN